ncbi:glycosyltransferase family 4 protein [Agromyces protaetiae]|nr:glycosyltransferase family 4 protein [Agromyces protaetiae]
MPRPKTVLAEPAFRTRSANPYNARLYEQVEAHGWRVQEFSLRRLLQGPEIVHMHWPELLFLTSHRPWEVAWRLFTFSACLRVARARGTRLVWTAHNLEAHEERSTPEMRARLRRLWGQEVDGVLVLSENAIQSVQQVFPEFADVPVKITPHGHYRDDYLVDQTAEEARQALGIDPERTLIAYVGAIRAYKNVPALLQAFSELDDPGTELIIAGAPTRAIADDLTARAQDAPRIRMHLGRLSEDEMARWLRAANLVVLPYLTIQNSGSAILALSADRPVVAPALGAIPELAREVGSEWVFTYDGPFTAQTLERAMEWLRDTPRPARPDLGALDWSTIGRLTIAAYDEIQSMPRQRRS